MPPALLSRAQHNHVSEREIAHRWPNGQWDDAAWEDCTFMTGVEWCRLTHSRAIPPTHFEGERLRQSSGSRPSGGTNIDDLSRGIRRRYGYNPGTSIRGFGELWRQLKPGKAAVCQGVMGVFPYGHRLRRWDRGFNGKHCVLVVRVDASDRVWWCDPLAPEGWAGGPQGSAPYSGEWVTKAELKRYVDGIYAAGGRHLVGTVRHKYVVTVADNARLYVKKDLTRSRNDVIIHPGPRTMPYKGQATPSAKRVEYVNAKGVHTGVLYYVKNAVATNVRAL